MKCLIMVSVLIAGLFCINCSKTGNPGRVFYVNSYHPGYAPSDSVAAAVEKTLTAADVDYEVFYMDSKRRNEPELIRSAADSARKRIGDFDPDVLIVSDDNAVRYLVVPFYKNTHLPVVFCGVNWSCEAYGLPVANVTGMLEVLPVRQSIETLGQYYPSLKKLAVLSENTTSENKNKDILQPLYQQLGIKADYYLVSTFTDWQTAFLVANKKSDFIYAVTNGAIQGWDDALAEQFVATHIQKPVFTNDHFMMRFAMIGWTKIASEQGQWAAQTALDILEGADIKKIEVTQNKNVCIYINRHLAQKLGYQPGKRLEKNLQCYE